MLVVAKGTRLIGTVFGAGTTRGGTAWKALLLVDRDPVGVM
jgi:hypothetical protein